MRGIATMVVGDDDTSVAMHSGEVAVLATPRVVALCEEATCAALIGRLPAGVDDRRDARPDRPPAPDRGRSAVEAEAILDKIEGRRLTFTVSASDAKGLVAAGKVTRVVVDIDKFLAKTE